MPGNQGGSNLGDDGRESRRRGWCSSSTSIRWRSSGSKTSGRARVPAGRAAAARCRPDSWRISSIAQLCHGANLQGAVPGAPSLVGVTDRMGEDAIRAIVTGGRGLMRPVPRSPTVELTAVIAYLASSSPIVAAAGAAGPDRRRCFRPDRSLRAAARRSRRCRRAASGRSIRASAATPAATRIRTT